MIAIRLLKIDFDNMENGIFQATCTEELGMFVDDAGATAAEKIEKFRAEMPAVRSYEGWNGETYPQFKTEEVVIW